MKRLQHLSPRLTALALIAPLMLTACGRKSDKPEVSTTTALMQSAIARLPIAAPALKASAHPGNSARVGELNRQSRHALKGPFPRVDSWSIDAAMARVVAPPTQRRGPSSIGNRST